MADKLRCVSHPLMDAQHAVLHIYLWQNQLEHIIERIGYIFDFLIYFSSDKCMIVWFNWVFFKTRSVIHTDGFL